MGGILRSMIGGIPKNGKGYVEDMPEDMKQTILEYAHVAQFDPGH